MSAREILAYAITHAPKGVKGGPYVADMGYMPTPDLAHAWRSGTSELERARRESGKRRGTRVICIVRARPSPSDEQAKVDRREWERAEALLAASPSHRVILGPGLRQMSYCADAIADLLEAMPDDQMPKGDPGEAARTRAALLRGMDLAKAAKARPSAASAVEVLRDLVAWSDSEDADTDDVIRIAAKARRVLAASGPDPSEVVRAAMAWSEVYAAHGDPPDADLNAAVDAYRKAGGK